jgi:hypothetical protein
MTFTTVPALNVNTVVVVPLDLALMSAGFVVTEAPLDGLLEVTVSWYVVVSEGSFAE